MDFLYWLGACVRVCERGCPLERRCVRPHAVMSEPGINPSGTGGVGPSAASRVIAALMDDDGPSGDGLPTIHGFILSRKLGEGGGGVVYLGYREGSERPLAIKVLNQRVVRDEAASKRAWRELELLSALRLPALPRVIDYGLHEGRLYIATEYVDGVALDRHCAERGLDRRARVELLARVAESVQGLHEQGVIHRDLKPSNVLVDAQGRVSIIDLGIATLLTADVMETLTAEGAPIGSPAFMAPEQARGERDRISTRTDVYGLGAVAYLLLTGQTPHDMSTTIHEAVRRVAQDPARRARDLAPTMPRALAAVVEKAAAESVERRYGSAGELAADLRRWLAGEPVLADGLGVWQHVGRWIGGHPLVCTAAACVALAGSVLGTVWCAAWWAGTRPWSLVADPSAEGSRWVEIRSYSGLTLRRWESNVRGYLQPSFGQLDVARELGGGRVFFLVPNDPGHDPLTDQLCVYSDRNIRTPAWISGTGPPDIQMPTLEGFTAEPRFDCEFSRCLDVFAQSPGQEIVAVMHHDRWSPTVVRVYSARGEVLFECWHNGWINSVYWVAGAQLLVLTGVNSKVNWYGRGAEGLRHDYPSVVMAVHPQYKQRAGWIGQSGRAGELTPVWYKCLLPPEAADILCPDMRPGVLSVAEAETPDTMRVGLGSVAFTLDATGEEVGDRRVDVAYTRAGAMPDPLTYMKLGDLPPIIPERAVSARPANN